MCVRARTPVWRLATDAPAPRVSRASDGPPGCTRGTSRWPSGGLRGRRVGPTRVGGWHRSRGRGGADAEPRTSLRPEPPAGAAHLRLPGVSHADSYLAEKRRCSLPCAGDGGTRRLRTRGRGRWRWKYDGESREQPHPAYLSDRLRGSERRNPARPRIGESERHRHSPLQRSRGGGPVPARRAGCKRRRNRVEPGDVLPGCNRAVGSEIERREGGHA